MFARFSRSNVSSRIGSIYRAALGMVAFGLAGMGFSPLRAATVVQDEFDYPSGSNLHGQAGGSGWALGGWVDSGVLGNPVKVLSPGLTGSQDGFARMYDENTITRSFGSAIPATTGTTIWVGFVINKHRPNGFDIPENFNLFLPTASGGPSSGIGITLQGLSPGSTDKLMIKNNTTALANTMMAPLLQLSFFAVRITFGAASEDVALFLNPALDVDPTSPTLEVTAFPNVTEVGKVAVNWQSADVDFSQLDFDAFKVGTEFKDVTPAPEPSAALMAFTGIAFLSRRFTRRR